MVRPMLASSLLLLALLCVIILLPLTLSAQTVPFKAKESPEVMALRAQLELMRQYDQRLLSTVYWALGTLAVVAVALVGFGWFANFRVYERDKSALSSELKALISSDVGQISSKLENRFQEFQGSLHSTASQSIQSMKEAAKEQVAPINARIEHIRERLDEVDYRLGEFEVFQWEQLGVPLNALSRRINLLQRAANSKQDHRIAANLEAIKKILEAVVAKNDSLMSSELTNLSMILDALPSQHSILASATKSLLAKVRVYR